MMDLRWLRVVVAALSVAGCVSLTADPRAIIAGPEGVEVRTLPCDAAIGVRAQMVSARPPAPRSIPRASACSRGTSTRRTTRDGRRTSRASRRPNDIVLLQEVTLIDPMTRDPAQGGARMGDGELVPLQGHRHRRRHGRACADRRALHAARDRAGAAAAEVVGGDVAAGARLAQAPGRRQHPLDQLHPDARRRTRRSSPAWSRRSRSTTGRSSSRATSTRGPTTASLHCKTSRRSCASPRSLRGRAARASWDARSTTSWCAGSAVESAAAIAVKSSDHNPVTAVLRVTPEGGSTALP